MRSGRAASQARAASEAVDASTTRYPCAARFAAIGEKSSKPLAFVLGPADSPDETKWRAVEDGPTYHPQLDPLGRRSAAQHHCILTAGGDAEAQPDPAEHERALEVLAARPHVSQDDRGVG